MASPQELDTIRSKPIVQLTPAEIELLDEQEQKYVISFLAMPPTKWPYQD